MKKYLFFTLLIACNSINCAELIESKKKHELNNLLISNEESEEQCREIIDLTKVTKWPYQNEINDINLKKEYDEAIGLLKAKFYKQAQNYFEHIIEISQKKEPFLYSCANKELAGLYLYGLGVNKNYLKALNLLLKAYNEKYPLVNYLIFSNYIYVYSKGGYGIKRNYNLAIQYFNQSRELLSTCSKKSIFKKLIATNFYTMGKLFLDNNNNRSLELFCNALTFSSELFFSAFDLNLKIMQKIILLKIMELQNNDTENISDEYNLKIENSVLNLIKKIKNIDNIKHQLESQTYIHIISYILSKKIENIISFIMEFTDSVNDFNKIRETATNLCRILKDIQSSFYLNKLMREKIETLIDLYKRTEEYLYNKKNNSVYFKDLSNNITIEQEILKRLKELKQNNSLYHSLENSEILIKFENSYQEYKGTYKTQDLDKMQHLVNQLLNNYLVTYKLTYENIKNLVDLLIKLFELNQPLNSEDILLFPSSKLQNKKIEMESGQIQTLPRANKPKELTIPESKEYTKELLILDPYNEYEKIPINSYKSSKITLNKRVSEIINDESRNLEITIEKNKFYFVVLKKIKAIGIVAINNIGFERSEKISAWLQMLENSKPEGLLQLIDEARKNDNISKEITFIEIYLRLTEPDQNNPKRDELIERLKLIRIE